jgi:tRNA (guanine-N7-)-methyltransferase
MATVSEVSTDLIYELPSVVERLNLAELFLKPQPLEIELGCGDASFLVEYAQRYPERNFIGVERLLGRLRKLDRKGRRAGLTNLRGVRIESSYFIEYLLPPHSASVLHVYFPDPWPKNKHRKHRLINQHFADTVCNVLQREGVIYLRTDDRDYFEQMTGVFDAKTGFEKMETPAELAERLTDFEREFHERGIRTLRAAYRSQF